ncbi:hypothetical protein NP493_1094g03022 [Ridgeia piscesae]|uniref:G-protein coupled receptors family 1 profile domain-containing protein n=1 Tax=Ridgeia piscesae TaxID=27915 RepID=A0AAD9KHE9_RIDPI|nr:hypothetical protein NP493_1094g03022 [Ridgeia piscesae]
MDLTEPVVDTTYAYNVSATTLQSVAVATPPAPCAILPKFWINAVLTGSLCLLGIVGNTVSFAVLRRDREAPVASLLLQALAVADNLLLGLWFLHFSLRDVFSFAGFCDSGYRTWMYVRLFSYPLLFVAQTATIWTTVLIASYRYLAVCKPYRALTLNSVPVIQRSLAVVFSFAVLYNLPHFFEVELTETQSPNGTVRYLFQATSLGQSDVYRMVYFDVLYYIFSFALPLLLLVVLGAKLVVAYRAVLRRRRRSSRMGADQNITLVMIVVIVVFVVCNAPARVVQLLWSYRVQKCGTVSFVVTELVNTLEVLNSSVNFVIYCIYRRQFRRILRQCMSERSFSELYSRAGNTSFIIVDADTKV